MEEVKPLHEVMTKEELSKLVIEYTQIIESYKVENEELKEEIQRLETELMNERAKQRGREVNES